MLCPGHDKSCLPGVTSPILDDFSVTEKPMDANCSTYVAAMIDVQTQRAESVWPRSRAQLVHACLSAASGRTDDGSGQSSRSLGRPRFVKPARFDQPHVILGLGILHADGQRLTGHGSLMSYAVDFPCGVSGAVRSLCRPLMSSGLRHVACRP